MNNQAAFMNALGSLGNIGAGPARSTVRLEIGMHVLITDTRPYKEGRIVALASRYNTDEADYAKVSYLHGFFSRPYEEWINAMYLAPIGLVKQITHEEETMK